MLRLIFLLFRNMSIVRLVSRLMLHPQVPFLNKLLIPFAIVYLISPIDIIPDIVPLASHIDDAFVIAVSVILFLLFTPRKVLNEHLHGKSNSHQNRANPQEHVIDGSYRVVETDEEVEDK